MSDPKCYLGQFVKIGQTYINKWEMNDSVYTVPAWWCQKQRWQPEHHGSTWEPGYGIALALQCPRSQTSLWYHLDTPTEPGMQLDMKRKNYLVKKYHHPPFCYPFDRVQIMRELGFCKDGSELPWSLVKSHFGQVANTLPSTSNYFIILIPNTAFFWVNEQVLKFMIQIGSKKHYDSVVGYLINCHQ